MTMAMLNGKRQDRLRSFYLSTISPFRPSEGGIAGHWPLTIKRWPPPSARQRWTLDIEVTALPLLFRFIPLPVEFFLQFIVRGSWDPGIIYWIMRIEVNGMRRSWITVPQERPPSWTNPENRCRTMTKNFLLAIFAK